MVSGTVLAVGPGVLCLAGSEDSDGEETMKRMDMFNSVHHLNF